VLRRPQVVKVEPQREPAVRPGGLASCPAAFRSGLAALGYVEDQNLTIEQRYAAGAYDQLGELAANLIRLNPDVAISALLAAVITVAIKIVMQNVTF
jgi:putative tryptophan/tyrosine transport system substrate-binding protein